MMTWLGIAFMCLFFPENEPDPWPAPPIAPGEPTGDPTWWAAKLEYDLRFAAPELWTMRMALRFGQAMDAARQAAPIAPVTPPAEPRTAAGRALNALEGWDWAGLPNEEVLDRILAIEAEAALLDASVERLAKALAAVAPYLHTMWPVENYPVQRLRDLVDAALERP